MRRYLGHRDSRIINRDRLSGSGGGRGGGALFEQEDGSDDTEYAMRRCLTQPLLSFVMPSTSSSPLSH